MELLLLLAANPGWLIPRRAVVERVWGKDHFLEEDGAINTAAPQNLSIAAGHTPSRFGP
jgi:hypothetical protein